MSGSEARRTSAAPTYPPDVHVARALGLWIERGGDGARAGLPVVPQILTDTGHVRAGVLATLVDFAAGEVAVHAAHPAWTATSDLVLHLVAPVAEGELVARPRLLRKTRSTVVVEVEVAGARGPAALGTLSFALLPARDGVQRMGLGKSSPRTEFALPGSELRRPLSEALGVRRVDAGAGRLELPVAPYVSNSLGAVQGGVIATLVDLSAEAAARAATGTHCVTTDLALNYLALGRVGPIVSGARLLRRGPAGALLRVELRDAGAEHRLLGVATAGCGALHGQAG